MDLSRPASRILTMLELLQDHPGLTGTQLADRLDVSDRTVRRYVTTLQDMGIPVEPQVGRQGGYALRPGFRLPPLMFNADEALGLAIALMMSGVAVENRLPTAIQSALNKIERVLPEELANRVEAVRSEVALSAANAWETGVFPQPLIIATLAQAKLLRQRVWFRYLRPSGEDSARTVDPYGIGNIGGRWYLHGWCHLRKEPRTFRIDRIRRVDLLEESFVLPENLDPLEAIERSLALSWQEWKVEVIIHAPIDWVSCDIPRRLAILEEIGPERTRLVASTSDLGYYARSLALLDSPFEVVTPMELRDELRALGERLILSATASSSDRTIGRTTAD